MGRRHAVPSILAAVRLSWKRPPGRLGQAKGIVELPIGEQPGVGSDLGTVELQPEATVKIQPQKPLFRFTHRVSHINIPNPPIT